MANQLNMAVVHAIWTLARLGWSQRRIAQVLGGDRETVARCVHSPPAEFPMVKELSDYRFADVPNLNKKYVLDLARKALKRKDTVAWEKAKKQLGLQSAVVHRIKINR